MRKIMRMMRDAWRAGRLPEPFNVRAFRTACPGLAATTYPTFLAKHAKDNPGGNSTRFKRVSRGWYRFYDHE
jgi:hypothetical protein